MNIFILDTDPVKSAIAHCDKHVVKMVLESAQMLCTAQRILGNDNPKLYLSAYQNHPCTVWTRECYYNYKWHLTLFEALCLEYTYRYERKHKSSQLLPILREIPENIPYTPQITPFAQAMPDEYKNVDVVKAYQAFYRTKPFEMRYTKRNKPSFL